MLTINKSNINALLGAYNPLTDVDIFSNYTSQENLTRNTGNPFHSIFGSTGIIAWNSRINQGGGTQLGGVLITPQHILYTKHANYQVGNEVVFVDRSNNQYVREIEGTMNFPGSSDNEGDFGVALLDSALPEAIEPVKMLPADSYKYFDSSLFSPVSPTVFLPTASDCPFLRTDQEEKSLAGSVSRILFSSFTDSNPNDYHGDEKPIFEMRTTSTPEPYLSWYELPVGGDSGSPMFFSLNNELVFVGLVNSNSRGSFFGQARNRNAVDRMILDAESAAGFYPTGLTPTDTILIGNFKDYTA